VLLITFRDINGREKRAAGFRKFQHPIWDAINKRYFYEWWVEIEVVGRRRGSWIEYMPLDKFRELNPKIRI